MRNYEQIRVLAQGVDAWNSWRADNLYESIILDKVDLKGADLNGVQLSGANLWGADLSEAHLEGADFSEARLTGTNFSKAKLNGANFMQARLHFTDLMEADLREANFEEANISRTRLGGSHLSKSILAETVIGNTDLSYVIGLEEVIHNGPSTIGMDTIYRSAGKIPEVFLRGCGLSDLDIEYAKLARPGLGPEQVTDITYKIHQLYLGGGIHYYSCFISYSSNDLDFAQQLYDDLQNNGVRCWFAPEDMKIGDPIRPTIDKQVRLRDKLLVILSKNSVKSEWVGDEVEGALEEENKNNRLVLFPIRLDDTVMNTRDDWAAKIKRRRHIGDFSNWKDKASYQKAFERLLRDLKATGGGENGE